LQKFSTPLCSDALSGFINDNPNKEIYIANVAAAASQLYEKLLPQVALQLDNNLDCDDLVHQIHKAGLNCRHLGYIREYLPKSKARLKKLIITECVARVVKNQVLLK